MNPIHPHHLAMVELGTPFPPYCIFYDFDCRPRTAADSLCYSVIRETIFLVIGIGIATALLAEPAHFLVVNTPRGFFAQSKETMDEILLCLNDKENGLSYLVIDVFVFVYDET